MCIEIKNLIYKYSKKGQNILNDITLKIEPGTINILLGLNGSGKTTLIKTLVGLNEQYLGSISYFGKELKELKILERSKIISFVPQYSDNNLEIFVIDYLSYGFANRIKFYQEPSYEQIQEIKKYANKLGFEYLLNKKLNELSGGQRQIINIFSALLQKTEILILDEPTSSLDLSNQNFILNILNKIRKKENKTIIFSTHNPNHALFLNSNVILLDKGKIVCVGNSKDIINIKNLKPIYGEKICLSKNLFYDEISFDK